MKKMTLVFSALALLGACGSSEEEATPTTGSSEEEAAPTTDPGTAAPTEPTPTAPTAPAAATPVAVAGPGFTFTPVSGTAGGPTSAEEMGEDCVGTFPAAPQHVIEVGAAIPLLRVLVNAGAEADTTLAVRTPGGQVLCNDDSDDPENGLNPALDIENAAAGTYQVFVGGYSAGESGTAYRLTLSETADQAPSAAMPN